MFYNNMCRFLLCYLCAYQQWFMRYFSLCIKLPGLKPHSGMSTVHLKELVSYDYHFSFFLTFVQLHSYIFSSICKHMQVYACLVGNNSSLATYLLNICFLLIFTPFRGVSMIGLASILTVDTLICFLLQICLLA